MHEVQTPLVQEIACSERYHHWRLDKFLSANTQYTRSDIQKFIRNGCVSCDGRVITKISEKVHSEQIYVLKTSCHHHDQCSQLLKPCALPLAIIFEDQDILVINKPAGLVVHPGAGFHENTLVEGLLHHTTLATGSHPLRPGIVHRLDQGTSGIMIVAKTDLAYDDLCRQLKDRSLQRTYIAFVKGHPCPAAHTIKSFIERHPYQRTKRRASRVNGKDAITHYQCQEFFTHPSETSKILCRLETGRTHQIRVHMSWVGHPIIGDKTYNPSSQYFPIARPALHSHTLAFHHPKTQQLMSFSASLPDDLCALHEFLRSNSYAA